MPSEQPRTDIWEANSADVEKLVKAVEEAGFPTAWRWENFSGLSIVFRKPWLESALQTPPGCRGIMRREEGIMLKCLSFGTPVILLFLSAPTLARAFFF